MPYADKHVAPSETRLLSSESRRVMLATALILSMAGIMIATASLATSQTPDDLNGLTREAFGQLAGVYRSGGSAPELVSKLNLALELIQQARFKRLGGDEASALVLEQRAHVVISEILEEEPAAQQEAQRQSTTRTLSVFLSVPVVVTLSTLVFYTTMRTWRWYEKTKLFEMRIIGKKKEND